MPIDSSCVQLATMRKINQGWTHLLLHRRLLPGPGQTLSPHVVSLNPWNRMNIFDYQSPITLSRIVDIWMRGDVFLISGGHKCALSGAKVRRWPCL